MDPLVLVGTGGAIGSVLRFELSKIQPVRGIPAGTLLVNVAGSFAFSLVTFLHAPADLMYLVGIGGLGGFTTFSTFSYETFRMMENHDYYTMGVNILLNMAGSIAGVSLGYLLVVG
jgi:fluoride exporter